MLCTFPNRSHPSIWTSNRQEEKLSSLCPLRWSIEVQSICFLLSCNCVDVRHPVVKPDLVTPLTKEGLMPLKCEKKFVAIGYIDVCYTGTCACTIGYYRQLSYLDVHTQTSKDPTNPLAPKNENADGNELFHSGLPHNTSRTVVRSKAVMATPAFRHHLPVNPQQPSAWYASVYFVVSVIIPTCLLQRTAASSWCGGGQERHR